MEANIPADCYPLEEYETKCYHMFMIYEVPVKVKIIDDVIRSLVGDINPRKLEELVAQKARLCCRNNDGFSEVIRLDRYKLQHSRLVCKVNKGKKDYFKRIIFRRRR